MHQNPNSIAASGFRIISPLQNTNCSENTHSWFVSETSIPAKPGVDFRTWATQFLWYLDNTMWVNKAYLFTANEIIWYTFWNVLLQICVWAQLSREQVFPCLKKLSFYFFIQHFLQWNWGWEVAEGTQEPPPTLTTKFDLQKACSKLASSSLFIERWSKKWECNQVKPDSSFPLLPWTFEPTSRDSTGTAEIWRWSWLSLPLLLTHSLDLCLNSKKVTLSWTMQQKRHWIACHRSGSRRECDPQWSKLNPPYFFFCAILRTSHSSFGCPEHVPILNIQNNRQQRFVKKSINIPIKTIFPSENIQCKEKPTSKLRMNWTPQPATATSCLIRIWRFQILG